MNKLYERWINEWENRLCFRTNNRVARPFEWGLDWTGTWPQAQAQPCNGHTPEQYLHRLNEMALCDSDSFFGYDVPKDFRLEGDMLSFTSPVHTQHEKNNTVRAQWHQAKNDKGRAVVVLPHWNATFDQHGGLCRAIAKLGISALRISLPYHDLRMPPELHRADYAVSSNIGRTIDATRQAVIDSRTCFDWLASRGYERVGIVGTSLGSCYAFLAAAHDSRIKVGVYNHCSSYFADVVWTGLSTMHIRESIESEIELESLRQCWKAISPVYYLDKYKQHVKESKFIYTTYDTTFLPKYSKDIVEQIQKAKIKNSVAVLPCGHYTLGEAPYKYLVGWHICSFLVSRL
ncbi:MAG: alpha/beta hydrolase family protein [Bryobacteraceae bacterium]|nr:alpha/beta hydrolase family protein [Bryobacteraceae bacterium]